MQVPLGQIGSRQVMISWQAGGSGQKWTRGQHCCYKPAM